MPRKGEKSVRAGKPSPNSGMKGNQKLKPYLILSILQQKTDENHLFTASDIGAELQKYGISAERRSIGEDIKAINAMCYLLSENNLRGDESDTPLTIEEAIAEVEGDESLKAIVYVSKDTENRGYYFRGRKFDFQEIRLLAETIYNAKFLSESDSERLARVLRDYVSGHQAKTIKRTAYVTDRTKSSRSILDAIEAIDNAMATKRDGEKHEPEKIGFQYYSYSISNLEQVARRQGKQYEVSPYKVIVADGNYYLLAYDDNKKEIGFFFST